MPAQIRASETATDVSKMEDVSRVSMILDSSGSWTDMTVSRIISVLVTPSRREYREGFKNDEIFSDCLIASYKDKPPQ